MIGYIKIRKYDRASAGKDNTGKNRNKANIFFNISMDKNCLAILNCKEITIIEKNDHLIIKRCDIDTRRRLGLRPSLSVCLKNHEFEQGIYYIELDDKGQDEFQLYKKEEN